MSMYPDEKSLSAMVAYMKRAKAEYDLQNLIGPLHGIEDWPAHRVFDTLKHEQERQNERNRGVAPDEA